MKGILDWLKGKRTYIVAIAGAAFTVAEAFGVNVPQGLKDLLLGDWGLLGFAGLAAVRAGIGK